MPHIFPYHWHSCVSPRSNFFTSSFWIWITVLILIKNCGHIQMLLTFLKWPRRVVFASLYLLGHCLNLCRNSRLCLSFSLGFFPPLSGWFYYFIVFLLWGSYHLAPPPVREPAVGYGLHHLWAWTGKSANREGCVPARNIHHNQTVVTVWGRKYLPTVEQTI